MKPFFPSKLHLQLSKMKIEYKSGKLRGMFCKKQSIPINCFIIGSRTYLNLYKRCTIFYIPLH